jgi:hypothetical protein
MMEPSRDQIAKIDSIMVTPEENGSPARIEIDFHPGGYDAAIAFARWLTQITGKHSMVFRPERRSGPCSTPPPSPPRSPG